MRKTSSTLLALLLLSCTSAHAVGTSNPPSSGAGSSGVQPSGTFTTGDIAVVGANGTTILDSNTAPAQLAKLNVSPSGGDITNTYGTPFVSAAGKAAGSANYFGFSGGATGNAPIISALGSDTNINLELNPKGTGSLGVGGIPLASGVFSAGAQLAASNNPAFAIKATQNSVIYGITASCAPPSGWTAFCGYFSGFGLVGSSSNSGAPIFETWNSSGFYGTYSFKITDSNQIYSTKNTLDDGTGNAIMAKTQTALAFATTPTTVTASATPAIVATNGLQTYTLAQNAAPTITGIAAGQRVTFEVCQPASGGPYTWTWPASIHGGMTIGTTASTCSIQSFDSFTGTTLVAENAGVANAAP